MTTFDLKDSIEILTKLMEHTKPEAIDELARIFKGNPVLTVKASLFLKDNKYMSPEEYKNILSIMSCYPTPIENGIYTSMQG